MASQASGSRPIIIVPLAGNRETDEAYALGALLSKLLGQHLTGAGLPVARQRGLVRYMSLHKFQIPPDEGQLETLHAQFRPAAVIYGRYVLDDDGKLFGVLLNVDRPGVEQPPIEASTPLSAFSRFIEHISLALIEALGVTIDDTVRRRVKNVPRPDQFEAFRQVAQAQMAWGRGQHELALAAAGSALAISEGYEEALEVQAAAARIAGDTATVRRAFQQWSAAAVKRGEPLEGAERLMLLGHWLADRGEWPDAHRAYDAARSLFEREKDEVGAARAQNNLANLNLQTGRTQEAIKTYRRSLRVFETHANTQGDTASALLNVALGHKALGQRDEALVAVEQAVTLARGLKDTQLEARCIAARGTIHQDMGAWSQAEEDYVRAIRLLDPAGDEPGMAMVKGHQALLYRQQGNYRRAESLLLEALSQMKRLPQLHEQAVMWLNLADLYYAMDLYEQAWNYAERADEIFQQLKSEHGAQSRRLLAALERIPPPANASPDELPEEPLDDESLYNSGDLYNNEYDTDGKDSGDDDAGVNSRVGRT